MSLTNITKRKTKIKKKASKEVKNAVKAETPVKAKERKVKVITDQKKVEAFVNGELEKVTKILDGIAERTGFVYVVLNRRFASKMIDVSEGIIKGTSEAVKILKRRMDKVENYVHAACRGTEKKGGQK